MRKTEALRLKPGDEVLIIVGKAGFPGSYAASAEVLHVTPKGGVRVRITEGKRYGSGQDWEGPGTGPGAGTEEWFPYHHVHYRG